MDSNNPWISIRSNIAKKRNCTELSIAGLPSEAAAARLTHYRIDDLHSNAFTEWRRMGSPTEMDSVQYAHLKQVGALGKLDDAPASVSISGGKASLSFPLPRRAVSLLVLEWN